jgi:hypothetical protein
MCRNHDVFAQPSAAVASLPPRPIVSTADEGTITIDPATEPCKRKSGSHYRRGQHDPPKKGFGGVYLRRSSRFP